MSTVPTFPELDTVNVAESEVLEVASTEVEEVAPVEETVEPVEEVTEPKKSKPIWSQICAIVMAILAIVPFFVAFGVVTTGDKNAYVVGEQMTLIGAITALITTGKPLAPFAANRLLGILYNAMLYALAISAVLAVVFAVLAIVKKDKAFTFAKISATIVTLIFACYAIGYVSFLSYWEKFAGNAMKRFELITTALAFLSLIFYVILCGKKAGKKVWCNLLQFVITLVFTAFVVFAFVAQGKRTTQFMKATDSRLILLIISAVVMINLFLAYITMSCKKTKVLSLIRAIIMVVIPVALLVIAAGTEVKIVRFKSFSIYALAVAAVALLVSILPLIKKREKKAKVVEEEVVVVEEEPVPELEVAETAEAVEVPTAVAYEGGPIPVEMAEDLEAVEEPAPLPPVETADYDYYNSRSFDPFIASLNNEERNQFTELFILHYKGTLEALPEYKVGGDNKDFFRAIFINLGLYRDRIPDGLLEKIYKFAIRL